MKCPPLHALLVLWAFAGEAPASTVIISQPSFSTLADYSPGGFGQSFTASRADQIISLNLYISSSSGGSDITVTLHTFDSLNSLLGATVLGSGTLRENQLSTTAAWKTVLFSSPVSVQARTTYAFKIVAKDAGGSSGWNNYGASSTSTYASGTRLSISTGGTVTKATNDLAFEVVAIPETGTWSLWVMLGTLAATHRTRARHQAISSIST